MDNQVYPEHPWWGLIKWPLNHAAPIGLSPNSPAEPTTGRWPHSELHYVHFGGDSILGSPWNSGIGYELEFFRTIDVFMSVYPAGHGKLTIVFHFHQIEVVEGHSMQLFHSWMVLSKRYTSVLLFMFGCWRVELKNSLCSRSLFASQHNHCLTEMRKSKS